MVSKITLQDLGEIASTPLGRRNLTIWVLRSAPYLYTIHAELTEHDRITGERLSVLYAVRPANKPDTRRFRHLETAAGELKRIGIYQWRYEDHGNQHPPHLPDYKAESAEFI